MKSGIAAAVTAALIAVGMQDAAASNPQDLLAEDVSTFDPKRALVCSIALTGMHLPQDAKLPPRAISLTLGISSEIGGVVKGFAEEILADGPGGEFVRRRVRIEQAWVGIPGEEYTRPLAHFSIKEPNKVIYLTDSGFSIALLRGILENELLEVGVRLHSEMEDRVVTGRPRMPFVERIKFGSCLGDLLRLAANPR